MAAFVSISCSASKKPLPPQRNTIIVPETSRVTFDTVDLKTAPKVVRDVAKTLESQDTGAWAQVGDKAYFIVGGGERSKKYDITVDEILQHLPEQGFSWIDVKIKYKDKSQSSNKGDPVFTVVRANMPKSPSGVGFTVTGKEAAGPAGNSKPTRTAPTPSPGNMQAGITVEQPSANQEITSPVKIKGNIRSQGQKRVRLSTRGGRIIKEEVLPTGADGSFDINLGYSAPDMATPGQLSIIETAGPEEKVLISVPVVIK